MGPSITKIEMITESDAMRYEVCKLNFIQSTFYSMFPKLFLLVVSKRYSRYVAAIQQMRSEETTQ